MTDYERIKEQLRDRPYLIADGQTGKVRLASQSATMRAMCEGGEFPSAVILNAGEALKRFARLRGVGEEERKFSLNSIATIAGLSYINCWFYVEKGVLTPSIRHAGGSGTGDVEARFSWSDAFCAGIVGSLRRHGLKRDVLKKIQLMFCETKNGPAAGWNLPAGPDHHQA